jgi:hypothetical protein
MSGVAMGRSVSQPGCASMTVSLERFTNDGARGDAFVDAVHRLVRSRDQ